MSGQVGERSEPVACTCCSTQRKSCGLSFCRCISAYSPHFPREICLPTTQVYSFLHNLLVTLIPMPPSPPLPSQVSALLPSHSHLSSLPQFLPPCWRSLLAAQRSTASQPGSIIQRGIASCRGWQRSSAAVMPKRGVQGEATNASWHAAKPGEWEGLGLSHKVRWGKE